MIVLSPLKSEKLTIKQYIKMMADNNVNNKIISTIYEINNDSNNLETGYFVVKYDRPILREKTI